MNPRELLRGTLPEKLLARMKANDVARTVLAQVVYRWEKLP